jgi:hypothetical protein
MIAILRSLLNSSYDMCAPRKSVGYLSLALVLGILLGGVQEMRAQSFFGIPLFEGDAEKPLTPKSAPAEKEPPLEEWPLELSVHWAEYSKERVAGLAKVNKGYIPKLEEIKTAYTAADQLEDAIRTGREIERVEKEILVLEGEGELPALDSRSSGTRLPADALRAYRDQMELKARGLSLLNERYVKSVGELKTRLTGADELGGALAAKRIVEVLQQENAAFATLGPKATGFDPKIVGQWVFDFNGKKRQYQFNEDNTFEGHYPANGRVYRGTWRLEGTTVVLVRNGQKRDDGTIELLAGGEAEFEFLGPEKRRMTGRMTGP